MDAKTERDRRSRIQDTKTEEEYVDGMEKDGGHATTGDGRCSHEKRVLGLSRVFLVRKLAQTRLFALGR